MANVKGSSSTNSAAPGQLLGYGLQYTRLTVMLLTAPSGAICSVEVLEDVAQVNPDGTSKLSQTKSALTGNPVSDRAIPLWKTLAIWARQIDAGEIDPSITLFELYVSRPATGTIIAKFSDAKDENSAEVAIQVAKEILYGIESDPLPVNLKKYVDAVFGCSKLACLVSRLSLACGKGDAFVEVEEIIRGHPVSLALVGDIADHMCGWVKVRVDKMLAKGDPAAIPRDEFRAVYASYCQRTDRKQILLSASQPLPQASLEDAVKEEPNYVRQLRLVRLDYDHLLAAVSDFLRASIDRTNWAKAGEVDEASFDDLNEALARTWRNERDRQELIAKDAEEFERGKRLYLECMRYQTPVQGMQAPSHFVPGCYHSLADSLDLGWHPSFRELMTESSSESK